MFEFMFYNTRINIQLIDQIEMQNAVDQGRKYWKIDEANGLYQKKLEEQTTGEDMEGKIVTIEDDNLAQRILDKIAD